MSNQLPFLLFVSKSISSNIILDCKYSPEVTFNYPLQQTSSLIGLWQKPNGFRCSDTKKKLNFCKNGSSCLTTIWSNVSWGRKIFAITSDEIFSWDIKILGSAPWTNLLRYNLASEHRATWLLDPISSATIPGPIVNMLQNKAGVVFHDSISCHSSRLYGWLMLQLFQLLQIWFLS